MEKEDLIQKWLNESLTPEEQKAFDTLEDADLNKAIIEHAGRFKASQFSGPPAFHSVEKALSASPSNVRSLNWKRMLLQVASIVILGCIAYYGFFNNLTTTVTSAAKEKVAFTLPDASEVILNAGSTASFNEKKWSKTRSVSLDGEAFFKVAKGKRFDVVTSEGTVSVLGTQFNVKQRDSYFEVMCYEGLVQVATQDTLVKLTAGESIISNNGTYHNVSVTTVVPKWTETSSSFTSISLFRVFNELERQYGVTIIYNGSKKEELFTGGFPHDDLENALRAVTEPFGLQYSITDDSTITILEE